MTRSRPVIPGWPATAAIALSLVAIGAGITYLAMRRTTSEPTAATAPPAGAAAKNSPSAEAVPTEPPLADVIVTLTPDAVERAGIEVTPVQTGTAAAQVRVPGVVEPHGYRKVTVTPIAAGRVTRVAAELGTRVARGQALAQIYSPELAEAQTRYLSMRAELSAIDQQLGRTEKLVEIGAASRQELEGVRAERTSRATEVENARARLTLLGMTATQIARLSTPSEISATISVPAPIAGVVTERQANVGLNVDSSTPIFTVVDLSTVWVVGALYERDFSRVRVGSIARVTTTAYPDLVLTGRVSYIDPQVDRESRTAGMRVEVPNPRGELRLGMFAEVLVGEPAAPAALVVPRAAVQTVGDRQVVYVVKPTERGRFVEREVKLGATAGDNVEVLSGLSPGDVVVAKGSFFVRAERERLGLRQPPVAGLKPGATPTTGGGATPSAGGADLQVGYVRVIVNDQGFEPARVALRAGAPARITFVRTSDRTCGTEVVFPSLNIRRALPLNEPITIEVTPTKGEVAFTCGMNMLRGAIVGQ